MNEYNPTNNSISSCNGNSTFSSVVAVIPVDSANVVDAAAATYCQFEDVELADKTEMTDPTSSSASVNSSSEEEESTTLLGSARTPWYGTSLVLLAEVMGTGILSLPYAAVTLGWVSTLVLLPVFALLAYFSSAMLSYVQQRYPCINSYGDAATQLIGPKFGTFSNACMLLNWGSLAIYYLVAASNAIAGIAPDGWLGSCQLNRTIIAALLFLIPCQVRDFHSISKILSAPSFVAILIAVIIILVCLLDDSSTTDAVVTNRRTTLGPLPGTDGTSSTLLLRRVSLFVSTATLCAH
jgi:amino acid permease